VYNQKLEVVGFTIGSRGKVPGKTCEKRKIRNNNNDHNNQVLRKILGAQDG
jgi:hypothetical protein